MNILRKSRKSKNKKKLNKFVILIFSLVMTTFAWFAYTKILEPTLKMHIASWNIEYSIAGEKKSNPIGIEVSTLYPAMPEQDATVDIRNNGETLVDIEYEVKSISIAGVTYEVVQEGEINKTDNYIVMAPSVLTTDEATGEEIYKNMIINDVTRFPFTVAVEHSSQILAVTRDESGKKIPGIGYLKIVVNWIGDNDELDSEWGYKVGDYLINNPTATSAMSIVLSIESYQADPRTSSGGLKPSEIFDSEGTNPEGLHIGDFVNYDAGTWTQGEIDAIQTGLKTSPVTANGSTNRPKIAFQFGGFTVGSSRNGNATPHIHTSESTTYGNYVKDKSTGEAITGWRVFDVNGDKVTLISAGNPEDYYHPYETNVAYISEYILTGNVNSSWSGGQAESTNYQKRDWSSYINTAQRAESAIPLTKSKLDNWYTKYTSTPNANTYTSATFQKIYQEPYMKYQNMVDNYSYYWLSVDHVYRVSPHTRIVYRSSTDFACGVRILVFLSSDVRFTGEKSGTKTITGGNTTTYGGDQTYNVWDIH